MVSYYSLWKAINVFTAWEEKSLLQISVIVYYEVESGQKWMVGMQGQELMQRPFVFFL